MWDTIIYPFPNFNGTAVEVWERVSNFIPDFTGHVIIYPLWDQSWLELVNGTPDIKNMIQMQFRGNMLKVLEGFNPASHFKKKGWKSALLSLLFWATLRQHLKRLLSCPKSAALCGHNKFAWLKDFVTYRLNIADSASANLRHSVESCIYLITIFTAS